jgi:hypothetical protein
MKSNIFPFSRLPICENSLLLTVIRLKIIKYPARQQAWQGTKHFPRPTKNLVFLVRAEILI